MEKKELIRKFIENPPDFTEEEEDRIYKIAKRQMFNGRIEEVRIPVEKSNSRDPRISSYTFRKNMFEQLRNNIIQEPKPGFEVQKLEIVIDLDFTMFHAIRIPKHDENKYLTQLTADYSHLDTDSVYLDSDYLFVAARPNLKQILTKFKRFANLYVYSMGTQDYVEKILRKFNIDSLFKKAIGRGAQGEKSLRDIPGIIIENSFIIDDTVFWWRDEDQEHIIPSLKFAPLREKDPEYHKMNSPLRNSHCFFKNLDNLILDNSLSSFFFEDDKNQLKAIFDKLDRIHKETYCRNYTLSPIKYYMSMKKNYLKNKLFSMEMECSETNKKIYCQLIKAFGGAFIEKGLRVVEKESSQLNDSEISVAELFKKFFSLK